MTTPPPSSSPVVVTPSSAEAAALAAAQTEDQIRALAQQLWKSGQLGFDPTTILKGIVTAINHTGAPPTVSVQISGDTTTTIPGVRILNGYSPVVGHTVLIHKQGPDIFILGHIADVSGSAVGGTGSGWIRATLTNGSHGGNSNGDIYYRRILDHGSWKMQWRGGWSVSGTMMIDTANALSTEYRPTSKRSVLAARETQTGAISVQFDFRTDGRVEMIGATVTAASATVSGDVSFEDPNDITTFDDPIDSTTAGGADSHTHGVVGGHDHGVTGGHDHEFFGGGHTHTVSTPVWVSLNGVEYFI